MLVAAVESLVALRPALARIDDVMLEPVEPAVLRLPARELARAACVGWQGALGQIDDAVEESCVTSHLTAASWLGLLQRPTATATTDDWTWNDSAPVVYTRWQTGKPDDRDGKETGEEQCAKIQTDGTWDDVACTSSLDFVCERP